jgi:hypothetical protein
MSSGDNGPFKPFGADDGHPLSPFMLFCAYHLGLDTQGRKRFGNVHDVARGAGVAVADVEDALETAGLSAAAVLDRDFDLAGAQLDIQASPPGVDLVGIALMHWELFCAAPIKKRDWASDGDDGDDGDSVGDGGRRRRERGEKF